MSNEHAPGAKKIQIRMLYKIFLDVKNQAQNTWLHIWKRYIRTLYKIFLNVKEQNLPPPSEKIYGKVI